MTQMTASFVKTHSDNTLTQLVRYAFVGAIAFIVDFGSLYVLTAHFGVYYLHSAALAFVLGLTTNYYLSVIWVFQKRACQNRFLEYGIFGLLGVLGLGFNEGLMYLLTEHLYVHYLASKAIATAVVFVWNFGSRKVILFHNGPRPNVATGLDIPVTAANASALAVSITFESPAVTSSTLETDK
jgi:putative flippase GtrA